MRLAFVDTHVHLDDPTFDLDRGAVIARARSTGVRHWVNIGYCPARWSSTIALATETAGMTFTLGLHPGHADEFSEPAMSDLERLVKGHAPAAIGEVGLDFLHELPDRTVQRRAFEAQLRLASRFELPVVIHQRAASAECAEVLATVDEGQRVVLHSFDGSSELLALGLQRGWFFGVGGLMTRPSSEHVRRAFRQVPLTRLVLETDSPYLVPRGFKARRNTPDAIPHIGAILAELLQTPLAEVAAVTTDTAWQLFRLEERADGA